MIDLLSFTQCSWRCPYLFRYPKFARNPVHLSSLPEQLCASSSRLPHAVSWMREYTESIPQWPQMKYCYHNELACWRDRTFKFTRLITDTGGTLLFKEREDTAIRIHSSSNLCFLDSLVSWLIAGISARPPHSHYSTRKPTSMHHTSHIRFFHLRERGWNPHVLHQWSVQPHRCPKTVFQKYVSSKAQLPQFVKSTKQYEYSPSALWSRPRCNSMVLMPLFCRIFVASKVPHTSILVSIQEVHVTRWKLHCVNGESLSFLPNPLNLNLQPTRRVLHDSCPLVSHELDAQVSGHGISR